MMVVTVLILPVVMVPVMVMKPTTLALKTVMHRANVMMVL